MTTPFQYRLVLRRCARCGALEAVLNAGSDSDGPVAVWGRLALRQQELQLSTEVAKVRRCAGPRLISTRERYRQTPHC